MSIVRVIQPNDTRVKVISCDGGQVRVIDQQTPRVKILFDGAPGRNGSSAAISNDEGNLLKQGLDGGIFLSGGFGYLFKSDDGPNQIINSTPSRLRNNGASEINRLKGLFENVELIDGDGVFTPRAVDDVYRLVIRLTVAPTVINTDLTLQLDIGGTFGVIETESHRLSLGAGLDHQGTFVFSPFIGATFVANGGSVIASSDTAVVVKTVDYRVFPESVS